MTSHAGALWTLRRIAAIGVMLVCAVVLALPVRADPPAPLIGHGALLAGRSAGLAERSHLRLEPILHALDEGMLAVQVAVELHDGSLVLSSPDEIARTFHEACLEPLAEAIRGRRPSSSASPDASPRFILLVELLGDPHAARDRLVEAIEPFRDVVAHTAGGVFEPRPILLVLTGVRENHGHEDESPPVLPSEAGAEHLDLAAPWHRSPVVGIDWSSLTAWDGLGVAPETLRDTLCDLSARAELQGRLLRVFGAPDTEPVWQLLASSGVHLIGTERTSALSAWLENAEHLTVCERVEHLVRIPTPLLPRDHAIAPMSDIRHRPFALPGRYPITSSAAHIRVNTYPTSTNRRSELAAHVEASGPIGVTLNSLNTGDIDVNFAPAANSGVLNNASSPMWHLQRTPSGSVALPSGEPTYAWAPHPLAGVMLTSTASHPLPTGDDHHTHETPVLTRASGLINNGRAGAAYSMATGEWGPSLDQTSHAQRVAGQLSGYLWVVMDHIGSGGEANTDFGIAWLPYAAGWTGGYVAPMQHIMTVFPNDDMLALGTRLETRTGLRTIDFPRQGPDVLCPWVVTQHSMMEVASVFKGTITLPPGEHIIKGEGDDHWAVEILDDDGKWRHVAGVVGLHGMAADQGLVASTGDPITCRVLHMQGLDSWGLQISARSASAGQAFAPLEFDSPGLTIDAYSFQPSQAELQASYIRSPSRIVDNRCASPWLTPDSVRVARDPDRIRSASWESSLTLPEAGPDGGVLITSPIVNNAGGVLSLTTPLDGRWRIHVADHEHDGPAQFAAYRKLSYAFAFVPFDSPEAVSARYEAAEDHPKVASKRFRARRAGIGHYQITVPEGWDTAIPFVQPQMRSDTDPADQPAVTTTWEPTQDGSVSVRLWQVDVISREAVPADAPFAIALFPAKRSSVSLVEGLNELFTPRTE